MFDIIEIDIGFYRKCNKLSEYGSDFKNTWDFDQECGLSYVRVNPEYQTGYFKFKIVDKQKFMLAKIKYGI